MDLADLEVDLMVAPNSIQASRESVMDFTYPFFFDTMTFLVKRADPNRYKWKTLIDPLSWQVLVCVAVSLPTCAFILFVLERYNQYYVVAVEKPHGFQYAFWYMLGALLTQGNHKYFMIFQIVNLRHSSRRVDVFGGAIPPSSQSGRTLISFWWIFSIVLVATYSGNLIAFLTVTKEKLPFKTFSMVAEQKEYVWGVCGGTYIETYFEISPVPTFRKLWSGIQRNIHSHPEILDLNPEVHVQKVLNEDYVFFCDKTYFEILAGKDCRFVIGEEEYPNMNYAVGLPNNSAYTRLFSTK
ncbi:hypothetical protein KUTeg_011843 [Tegillarca granosa]|uniref:Ionotropic glutamate receptor C-terminal domain-containing protein n=1 Tax=Tegillarca granosa TaxID=220873 RepID=A0ABQ9EXU7_TEGGR|nr:hypothetical protein KUTeg_011843 [Tegillarca granosa]